ncbi:MAG: sn-glycerol-3-phosphate ABC transporter ATP-binding protein UgpC [Gemmatimonadaceae bacterium]
MSVTHGVAMASVSFEHVTKRFGTTSVVEDFDLVVEDGELLVLVGGSGSGKSTILRMLAGLEQPSSGTIRIDGHDVTSQAPRARDVAMVFQDYALYPHMTVRENLSLGLRLRNVDKAEIERRVLWASGILGLATLLDRKPKALSGGQRQRVAMGRAMVREPLVFLFDEPLSNLDAALRAQMRLEIGSLQRRLRTTTVYVTHDQVEAMTLGDRIVVLAGGRIQQVGRPIELYRAPANRFVAGFIGTPAMNFMDGAIAREDGRASFVSHGVSWTIGDSAAVQDGTPVTVGIRPEDIRVGASHHAAPDAVDAKRSEDGGPSIAGRVLLVERLGASSHVHVEAGGHRLMVTVNGDSPPELGADVALRLRHDRVHLFAPDGAALCDTRSGDDSIG